MSDEKKIKEATIKDGKIFTMEVSQTGDEVGVNTEFHQRISGEESLSVMKTACLGTIETTIKLGMTLGLTKKQVTEYLFG